MNTTDWARKNGRHFHWRCAVDNYEPTRDWEACEGWEYDGLPDGRGPGIVLDGANALKDFTQALYLIDDGHTVVPYYVVSYNPVEDWPVILHPFPVDRHQDGSPILRQDNGRPVDFSTWALGPRRTYHLKITRSEHPTASERRAGAREANLPFPPIQLTHDQQLRVLDRLKESRERENQAIAQAEGPERG